VTYHNMLYLVLGNNREAQKKYIHTLETSIEGDFLYLDKYSFNKDDFESQIFGTNMFGDVTHIVLDEVCETKEMQDYIVGLASEIKKSQALVILLQKDASQDFLEELGDFLTETVEYKLAGDRPDFSLWAAFYSRDKKASWMEYSSQVETEPVEKIHGGILSQTKNMYKIKIATSGDTYKTLGFSTEKSFNSASSAAKKFSVEELSDMYYSLVEMPLLAHNGETDFKLELEKFFLTYL
jgi:hypothetical protein